MRLPKRSTDKKQKKITVTLTGAELRELQRVARVRELDVSELLRETALVTAAESRAASLTPSQPLKARPSASDWEFRFTLHAPRDE